MADIFTKEKRSQIMSRVRGKDTGPEKMVRGALHRMGYRFRLHRRDLPGNPDIVLPKHRKVIFVHGCFWHGHENCSRSSRPASNTEFWETKISRNIQRDRNNLAELNERGWKTLVIWGCETKKTEKLCAKLEDFLAK